jgi:hypothetical protein
MTTSNDGSQGTAGEQPGNNLKGASLTTGSSGIGVVEGLFDAVPGRVTGVHA